MSRAAGNAHGFCPTVRVRTPGKGKAVADYIGGAMLSCRANVYRIVEPWRDSFTDIVDSTRHASKTGDRDWRALLDAHDAIVRSQLARFPGREVNTPGNSFLATFDGPQRAIRGAMVIRDAVQLLGIQVRAGLHTGECEPRGNDIGGIGVHIGARVSAKAGPNDVLVSNTLRDHVIGSGPEFEDCGTYELKGVPGEWRLSAVTS